MDCGLSARQTCWFHLANCDTLPRRNAGYFHCQLAPTQPLTGRCTTHGKVPEQHCCTGTALCSHPDYCCNLPTVYAANL